MTKFRTIAQICAVICLTALAATLQAADGPTTAKAPVKKSAYAAVAPYVNSDTFLVAHLSFRSVDVDKVCGTISQIFDGYMHERGFEKNSINAANREFKKTIAAIKGDLLPLTAFQAAVPDIFLVMQRQNVMTFRVIMPLAPEHRPIFKQSIGSRMPAGIQAVDLPNGIAFILNKDLDDEIYKNFKPGANDRLMSYYANSPDATIQIYVSGLKAKKLIDLAAEESDELKERLVDAPKEFQKGLDSFDQYFQCGFVSYNLNTLEFKETLQFTTAEKAEDFRVGLLSLVDREASMIVDELKDQDSETIEKYNLAPLAGEMAKGQLKSLIPTRTDSVLSFESTLKTKTILTNSVMPLFFGACLLQANKDDLDFDLSL